MINIAQEKIMEKWGVDNAENPLVSIRCITYNQEKFIAQTLDSFLMQKTTFPFEIIVHDDASTDNTANIIREYEAKFPKIIKPIYETENQWSKPNNVLGKIVDAALNGKYVALCEGDDYWIDENKLQKQVDYLEKNDSCTLCFSNAKILYDNNYISNNFPGICKDRIVSTEEIIINGGLYIPTPSIVYRKDLKDDYPEFCRKCWVGDYPLQIYSSIKGSVFAFCESTAVYRKQSTGSWTQRTKNMSFSSKKKGIETELNMLNGINEISNYKYNKIILKRKIDFLGKNFIREIRLVLMGKWYNLFLLFFFIVVKILKKCKQLLKKNKAEEIFY